MSAQKTIEIEWVTWEPEAEPTRKLLGAGGEVGPVKPWKIDADMREAYGDHQLDPLVMFVGVITVAWLAREIPAILAAWRRPEGVVIDTRGGKLKIRPDPRLERGVVVIIADEGKQVFHSQDRGAAMKLLEGYLHGK